MQDLLTSANEESTRMLACLIDPSAADVRSSYIGIFRLSANALDTIKAQANWRGENRQRRQRHTAGS